MKSCIKYLILLLFAKGLYANDAPVFSLTKVSPEGGVTYNSVMCIAEDEMGFIWFGSNDGLFCYNSKEFKRFSHFRGDNTTIPTNRINALHKDLTGRLWVATENGICSYNSKQDNFTNYQLEDQFGNPAGKIISSLFQTGDSTLWFADERGFGTLNLERKIALYQNIQGKNIGVDMISRDDRGTIWVFYRDGDIYYKIRESNSFYFFTKALSSPVRDVFIEKGKIWIAYVRSGLLCLDINGSVIRHFTAENGDESAIPSNQVRSILKDENGLIWAATYKGIAIIEDDNVIYVINSMKYSELPNQSVWSLFMDSQKNVWIGTFYGGVCFHSKNSNYFNHHTQSGTNPSLSFDIVSSFVEVPGSLEIIVGTEDGVLNYFDPETNLFTKVQVSYNGIRVSNIKSLAFDRFGTLWVGTYEHGVLYKEKTSQYFKQLKLPFPAGFQALYILAVTDGIWVSNYPIGVYFYDFKTGEFTSFQHNPLNIHSISNNNIRQILEDRNGNFWFATRNGLNLKKKGSNEFIHYFREENNPSSLSSNMIYSMYEDDQGYLWLGTNGEGLDRFDPETGIAEHFTTEDGLLGNEIFSILPDRKKNLWITTNQGLSMFNPELKSVRSFSNKQGIANNRFNPNASLLSSFGDLYFGGTNGFIRFKAKNITSNPVKPNTIITDLYINNQHVKPGDITSGLEDIIGKTKSLELDYTQNTIGFRFVSNNYIEPSQNQFKYRLLGFNSQWISVAQNEMATFTKIPPGRYTFEVKAANNDGVWNEIPTSLSIRVFPPIWLRWYAYLFYSLIVTLIIFFLRKQRIKQQKLKKEIEFEINSRKIRDHLHQMKLQFFTNISHEFRTPLTLIQGPANRLLHESDHTEQTRNYLTLIKSNTDRLLRLTNQFLDFRKLESDKLKLSSVNTDIIDFCRSIYSCFEENARMRGFSFSFITDLSRLKMDFDPDKLDKVLFNLLSNAFKNTQDDGKVTLEVYSNVKHPPKISGYRYSFGEELNEDFVEITVTDTGKGIPEKHLSSIFERFYQIENNSQQGTGIGLSLSKNYVLVHRGQMVVHSKLNKGSEFKVVIPQKQAGAILPNETGNDKTEFSVTNNASIKLSKSDKNLLIKEKAAFPEALVLIVEDHIELLDYLGKVLQSHFRIAKSRNGKLALEQIHTMYPDLVLSDIMMPEMDGIELCETIKNDIKTSHIPVVLLTALESVEDRISGIQSGADAYIAKPFDDTLLIAQINSLLESRKKLRESFSSKEINWEEKYSSFDLDKKLLIKAVSVVEENISDIDLSVQTLAYKLNLSRTHLHRKLKSLTNQSASEFIRDVRLKNAVKLMKEGKLKVNEVGYAVGFNSHNYFTRSFKKQYGISPSEFMKDQARKKE